MPTYEIELNGSRYQIDAPDDASAANAIKTLQQPVHKSHLTFEEGEKLLEAQQHQESMRGANGTTGAALTGFANGIPIAGPAVLGGMQRAAAGISSVIDGDSYEDKLKAAQDLTSDAQAAHPIVTKAGEVAGGVAATIPAVMAAPAAFGAGGGSMLLRSGIAGLTGGTIGGADAAVRSGGDPHAIKVGAGAGFLLGGAGPALGRVVGKGVSGLVNAMMVRSASKAAGVEPQALSYLRRAVTDDGLDATTLPQRLSDMGPDAMLADAGPNLQKQAGALAATPGRAQEVVRSALDARQSGANARLASSIDENLGPNVVPSEVQADIAANQRAVGPSYGQAFADARPYDLQPIADTIDADINRLRGPAQAALRQVRGMLNVNGTGQLSSDPRVMFETRQAIDGLLSNEQNVKAISALTEARQMLDDGLTRAVPRIKEPDAMYAELARQNEAVGRGQQVLDSGRTAPRPSELAQEVEQGAQPQGMQIGPSAVPLRLSQGARAEVDRIVGTNANDINAMNKLIKGEGDWNRDRLATLFGQDKADRLFKVLENERVFADTNNVVTRNSETSARQAAQTELGGAEGTGFGTKEAFKAGGVKGLLRSYATDKADSLVKALMSSDTGSATRESLARALVGNERDKLVQALAKVGNGRPAPALVDPLVKSLLLTSGTAGTR